MIVRRLLTALLALGLLSGCAAGHNAITIKPYTPTDGNQAQSANIKARNFLVVEQSDGSATLVGTLVNGGGESDAVTNITVNGQAVVLSSTPLSLAENQPVIFGGEASNTTGSIPALGAKAGQLVPVEITFEKASPIEMTIVVRAAAGEFATS